MKLFEDKATASERCVPREGKPLLHRRAPAQLCFFSPYGVRDFICACVRTSQTSPQTGPRECHSTRRCWRRDADGLILITLPQSWWCLLSRDKAAWALCHRDEGTKARDVFSFHQEKAKAAYVLLAQNAPHRAHYHYSFYCARYHHSVYCAGYPAACGHQLDLWARYRMPLSKTNLGYGYSRARDTARHQIMNKSSNCTAVLLDRRAGRGWARSSPGRQRCACWSSSSTQTPKHHAW